MLRPQASEIMRGEGAPCPMAAGLGGPGHLQRGGGGPAVVGLPVSSGGRVGSPGRPALAGVWPG